MNITSTLRRAAWVAGIAGAVALLVSAFSASASLRPGDHVCTEHGSLHCATVPGPSPRVYTVAPGDMLCSTPGEVRLQRFSDGGPVFTVRCAQDGSVYAWEVTR